MDDLTDQIGRPRRSNELRRAIWSATQESPSTTLRRLERNGIIEREVVATRPVAVRCSTILPRQDLA